MNESTELCSLTFPVTNINCLEMSSWSKVRTFPPFPPLSLRKHFTLVANTPGQWLPHESCQLFMVLVPQSNSNFTRLLQVGKHRSLGASVWCASSRAASPGEEGYWCCCLWRSLGRFSLRIPGLSHHSRANEIGLSHGLGLVSCGVWKYHLECHRCPTYWWEQTLIQILVPGLPCHYSKNCQ